MARKTPIPTQPPEIVVTGHVFSQTVCAAIHAGTGWQFVKPEAAGSDVVCYGILRGCGEAMQRADTFQYVDHGYFGRSFAYDARGVVKLNGYYRLVRDSLWHDCTVDDDWARFDALGIKLKPFRKSGRHIVVVPPSDNMARYLGLDDWAGETLRELRKHTDRDVIVHEKGSKTPLREALDGAWCMVTHHSNAAIDALTEGIPAIMTGRGLGALEDVEKPPMRRDFFARLANSQFTLEEFEKGVPWR